MPNGIEPLSQRGISPYGLCGLCGFVGHLSRTHVPPQCAGNTTDVESGVAVTRIDKSGVRRLGEGRKRNGGAAAFLLCEPCNGIASKYDDAFGQIWKDLFHDFRGGLPAIRGPHPAEAPLMRPGAIVRSVLAGLMGLCPTLQTDFPTLVGAVKDGAVVRAPEGLHLLMTLYPGPDRWVSGGGIGRQTLRAGRAPTEVYAYGEVAWPPLYFILTDQSGKAEWPDAYDILSWLADEPGVERSVALLIPVLRANDLFTSDLPRDFTVQTVEAGDGKRVVPGKGTMPA